MWRITRQNSGDADVATDQGSFDQQLSGLIGAPLNLPGLATTTTLFAGPAGAAGVADQTRPWHALRTAPASALLLR
jgi:hypothetical protein